MPEPRPALSAEPAPPAAGTLWQLVEPGPAAPAGPDWPGLLARLRDRLAVVAALPPVQADPACQALLEAMVQAEDMSALAGLIDRLGQRLAAARPAAAPPATRSAMPREAGRIRLSL